MTAVSASSNMIFECRVTRSCIYWKDDQRENTDFEIEAGSLEEAKEKLRAEALRIEFRSGASKLVQDIMIKIDGEWVNVQREHEKNSRSPFEVLKMPRNWEVAFLSAISSGYLMWISPLVPNGWGVLTFMIGVFGFIGSYVYFLISNEE